MQPAEAMQELEKQLAPHGAGATAVLQPNVLRAMLSGVLGAVCKVLKDSAPASVAAPATPVGQQSPGVNAAHVRAQDEAALEEQAAAAKRL
eukprot:5998595-Alexandrium_andersonii.AAC.1